MHIPRVFASRALQSSIHSAPQRLPSIPIVTLNLIQSSTFTSAQRFHISRTNAMPEHKHIDKNHVNSADEAHQYQAGATTNRKEDEWKHREPYRIHGSDESFDAKWKGGCHCGKVKYELSRDRPLASKYCHCTTCQRLHGVSQTREKEVKHTNISSLHSSGLQSSTKLISISQTAFTTWGGMIPLGKIKHITCLARSNVLSAVHRLWMRVET